MIVLTGFGRSGTSSLALLYKELGFDPGGTWNAEMNAGLEDPLIWGLNDRIAGRLGCSIPGSYHQSPVRRRLAYRARRVNDPFGRWLLLLPPATLASTCHSGRVERVVDELGDQMRRAASDTAVVKDPRMLWTVGAWLAAGASVEHVVIAVRELDQVVASRVAASGRTLWSQRRIRTASTSALVRCIDDLARFRVPQTIVRYPDFTYEPDLLHATLPFPEPVGRARFGDAFDRVMRRP